jgi:HK97 family phage prohead protease
MPLIERRAVAHVELRADENDASRTVVGLASVYGVRANIGGMFTEEIAPGAFTRSLTENDLRALYQHDMSQVIGRQSAGTLRARETARGVEVEIDVPEARDDVLEAIRRGDIDGMSIGFRVRGDTWSDLDTDTPHRLLTDIDLVEVSPVTFPAYVETEIGMRSDANGVALAEEALAAAKATAEAARAAVHRSDLNRMTGRLMGARLT